MVVVKLKEQWCNGFGDFEESYMTDEELDVLLKKYNVSTSFMDWQMVLIDKAGGDSVLIKEVLSKRKERYLVVYNDENTGSFLIYEVEENESNED